MESFHPKSSKTSLSILTSKSITALQDDQQEKVVIIPEMTTLIQNPSKKVLKVRENGTYSKRKDTNRRIQFEKKLLSVLTSKPMSVPLQDDLQCTDDMSEISEITRMISNCSKKSTKVIEASENIPLLPMPLSPTEEIDRLKHEKMQLKAEISEERNLRKKFEKNLIKLAQQMKSVADEVKRKDTEIKNMHLRQLMVENDSLENQEETSKTNKISHFTTILSFLSDLIVIIALLMYKFVTHSKPLIMLLILDIGFRFLFAIRLIASFSEK